MTKLLMPVICLLLAGCAPSAVGWKDSMDSLVGTHLTQHADSCSLEGRKCTGTLWSPSLWSPANDVRGFDQIEEEKDGKRYYVTWMASCKYSVFVSAGGVIISWRYETSLHDSCYVF